MFKKLFFALVFISFFSFFNLARAGVIINEVKLYPTEDRFIELYNEDNTAVDLTDWYIQRKTATGSSFGSLVSKSNFENKTINPKGYFLISRSQLDKSDIVLGTLTLTESNAIQIKNSGGAVVEVICWGEVNDCGGLSTSNPPEGQSIQKTQGGSVIVGAPTPGAQNFGIVSQSGNPPVLTGVSASGPTSQATTETKIKPAETLKIKTKIKTENIGFVGIPFSIKAETLGYGGEMLYRGKYFWNFGDADSKEVNLSDNQLLTHTYYYPGDYVVSLSYYQNYYSNIPDASDRVTVKIINMDVSISRVGDERDFFIELSNNTDYDVDISNWVLRSGEKIFTIPRNTILFAEDKIIISPFITRFSFSDKSSLQLLTPERAVVFSYKPSPVLTVSTRVSPNPISQEQPLNSKAKVVAVKENLVAEAVAGDIREGAGDNWYIMVISLAFICFSAYAVYFIRQKRATIQNGNDFEILDE